jgi:N4-(beta-N-acetylglucosaminyl)-L-asparaginase
LDGPTNGAGAVAGLKRVKDAISVARAVMDHTKHTMIVGDSATQFAIDMGFQQEDLHAVESLTKWIDWFNGSCQPNFRKNVLPDSETSCGPYKPIDFSRFNDLDRDRIKLGKKEKAKSSGHDTIG